MNTFPIPAVAQQRTNKIIKGSLSFFLSTGITLAVGLILTGLLARYFSPEEFGLWSILMSLNGILITGFDLGFGNALRNKLAQLYSQEGGEAQQSQIYFFSIFYCFCLGAVILTGIFFILKRIIPWAILFNAIDPRIIHEGSSLMILGACILAFNIAFNLYTSGFFGYQESHWNAFLNGVSKLALLLGILLLVISKSSFYLINLMFFLITLLVSVVSFYIFIKARKWRWQRIPFAMIFDKVKELWGKSAQFALLQIFSTFLLNADYFVVSKVLGLETVGDYFIIKRVYLVIASFHFALLLPIWSAYTEAVERKDFAWVEKTLQKTVYFTGIIFCAGILLMICEGNVIIYLWTGKEIPSLSLFLWLGVWGLVYGWGNCFSVFLNGIGVLKRQVMLVIGASIIFIPLALILGERYGINGICWALIAVSFPAAISNPIQSISFLQKYTRKER